MYPPFLFSKISSLNWPSQCWSPSPGKYDTYLWQHYSFHCPGFIKTHKRLLMFFQMFQFRLGGKTTNISCKGHKEDASVYGVSTKQYSNSFATDGERLCRAVPYGEKDCAGLYPTGGRTFILHPDTNCSCEFNQFNQVRCHSLYHCNTWFIKLEVSIEI